MELCGWAAVSLEELGTWGEVSLEGCPYDIAELQNGNRNREWRLVWKGRAMPVPSWFRCHAEVPCRRGKEQGFAVMVRLQYVWGCLLTYSPLHTTQSLPVYSHRSFWSLFRWCFWFLLFLAHGLNTLSTTILNSQFGVLGLKPAQSALPLLYCFSHWLSTRLNFGCGFFSPHYNWFLLKLSFLLPPHSTVDLNSEHSSMAEYYVLSTMLHLQQNTAEIGNTLLLFF